MRRTLPLLLLAGCAVLPISPRRMGTLEERVATLEKRLDSVEQAQPAFSLGEEAHSSPVASVGMTVPYEAATKTLLAARNSSGTYSLVSGNPVVTGTTITSTWANNTLSDIATELTDSLSRSGKGGMLAALKLTAGTVSAPSLYFSTNTGDGFYQPSAGTVAVGVSSAQQVKWDSGGMTSPHLLTATALASSNTAAIVATGDGTGPGVTATGGNGAGANGGTFSAGSTSGNGAAGTGKGAGAGFFGTGGDASGYGLFGTGGAPNGGGLSATGTGTGSGAEITAGATGIGLHVSGGATSNNAFKLDIGNTVSPPFRFGTGAAPSGAAVVGDMYMTTAGVLKVCVTAGTPCASFVSVGSQ